MRSSPPLILLQDLAAHLETLNTWLGKAVSWLMIAMALTVTVVVGLRALGIGSVFAQESVVFMHAALLMVASAYTLAADGHVRVDILYRNYSPLQKAWLDMMGALLFLLPLAIFTAVISWDFVVNSWLQSERSQNAGGLQSIYWIKSLILVNGALLTIQALSSIAKNLVRISFKGDAHG